jgi:hypothetical protein
MLNATAQLMSASSADPRVRAAEARALDTSLNATFRGSVAGGVGAAASTQRSASRGRAERANISASWFPPPPGVRPMSASAGTAGGGSMADDGILKGGVLAAPTGGAIPTAAHFADELCESRKQVILHSWSNSRDEVAREDQDATGAVVRALLISDAVSAGGEAGADDAGGGKSSRRRLTTAEPALISARFTRHTAASASHLRADGKTVVRTAPAFVNVGSMVSRKMTQLKARAAEEEAAPAGRRAALELSYVDGSGDDAAQWERTAAPTAGAAVTADSARRWEESVTKPASPTQLRRWRQLDESAVPAVAGTQAWPQPHAVARAAAPTPAPAPVPARAQGAGPVAGSVRTASPVALRRAAKPPSRVPPPRPRQQAAPAAGAPASSTAAAVPPTSATSAASGASWSLEDLADATDDVLDSALAAISGRGAAQNAPDAAYGYANGGASADADADDEPVQRLESSQVGAEQVLTAVSGFGLDERVINDLLEAVSNAGAGLRAALATGAVRPAGSGGASAGSVASGASFGRAPQPATSGGEGAPE